MIAVTALLVGVALVLLFPPSISITVTVSPLFWLGLALVVAAVVVAAGARLGVGA